MKIPDTYTGKGLYKIEIEMTGDTYMKLVKENSEII